MKLKTVSLGVAIVAVVAVGAAYASFENTRTPVDFYKGHTHAAGETINAPEHSGGTDRYGCHNASVPYHCH